MTIFADGLHSFADGASNIIGLVGVSIAASPADKDHPYGRQKYETLASTVIAFLLFLMAVRIFKEAIFGFIQEKTPEVSVLSFALMAGMLFVNLFVVWYERREAKRLQSDILTSDSWHTLTDIFITISVLAALVGIRLHIPKLDAGFAFFIAAVIVTTAFGILKHSSDILTDRAVLEPSKIERIVRAVDGVRDCHEIRTRGRVDEVYVDLHVLVDNEMTVIDSHQVATLIEKKIRTEIPGVHDVVVHIEPFSHDHTELET